MYDRRGGNLAFQYPAQSKWQSFGGMTHHGAHRKEKWQRAYLCLLGMDWGSQPELTLGEG